jgi:hypothetical protein
MLAGMDTCPTFKLVVVGAAEPAAVDENLESLLRFKLHTNRVVLYAGTIVRRCVGFFAVRYSLPVEPIPDSDDLDPTVVFRNAGLLKVGNAFLAFGKPAQWTRGVVDLIDRAMNTGLTVRVIEESAAPSPPATPR